MRTPLRLLLPLALLAGCDPVDRDADGWPASADCDDNNAFVHPNAAVGCDCSSAVDEVCGPAETTPTDRSDVDRDGFWVPEDCDDTDAAISPAADELCDGVDQDCDGAADNGVTITAYADRDSDGFGDPGNTSEVCEVGGGWTLDDRDCDDDDAGISPAADDPLEDGVDQDCDGLDYVSECANPVVSDNVNTWYHVHYTENHSHVASFFLYSNVAYKIGTYAIPGSPDEDTIVNVYDGTCTAVASDDDGGAEPGYSLLYYVPPASGWYTVTVGGWSGTPSQGDIEFRVETNEDIPFCADIAGAHGQFPITGFEQQYRFGRGEYEARGIRGDNWRFVHIWTDGPVPTDTEILMYNEFCDLLSSNDNANGSVFSDLTVADNGLWWTTMVVRGSGGGATGDFTLHIEEL